ncbi:MAG: hypothetical protein HOO06_00055 [Bdellovibrionaceae bacterium]|nr:hypothetical protein [Pseudobdellovibrionaceae bacterium]
MKRKKKINVILSKERDIPLLSFLWRWKVCTTMALCKKFYVNANVETGYRRLLKLEAGEFIKCSVDSTGQMHLWTLDKKGFEVIKDDLPTLKEEGYKSENLIHDYLATAIHLGEFLIEKPDNVIFITEQILRRVHEDAMPEWIPRLGHRPDGYWCIQNGESITKIALEVELSAKRNSDYELIDGFYRAEKVDHVFWIMLKESLIKRIHNQFMKYGDNEIGPHSFLNLEEFKTRGWQAKFQLGRAKGKSISQLLHKGPTTSLQPVVSFDLLNYLKSPHRSKTYVDTREEVNQ